MEKQNVRKLFGFAKPAVAMALASTLAGCVTVQEVTPTSTLQASTSTSARSQPQQASQARVSSHSSSPFQNPEATGIHQVCADLGNPTVIVYATNKGGLFGHNYYMVKVTDDTPQEAFDAATMDVTVVIPGKVLATAHFQKRPFDIAPEETGYDNPETNFMTGSPSGYSIMQATRPLAEIARRDAASRNLAGACLEPVRAIFTSLNIQ